MAPGPAGRQGGALYEQPRPPAPTTTRTSWCSALPTRRAQGRAARGYHGRYLPSGHLVYIHDGTLFAAPFDLDRLEVTGQPVPALEGVTSNATTGGAQFAVSASGTLVYLPGPKHRRAGSRSTGWIATARRRRCGRRRPTGSISASRPMAAGSRWQIVEGLSDIWVYEWARDTLTRLTSDPANDQKPVWTPDGRRIVFASRRADKSTSNLYWQRADGTGDAERLTESRNQQYPGSWHPSGKFLAFQEQNPTTNWDLMILPMEGDDVSGWKPGKPYVFLNSPDAEEAADVLAGRAMAGVSTRANPGAWKCTCGRFPGLAARRRSPPVAGSYPPGPRTKPELFYGTLDSHIMVATYSVDGDSFRAEKPRLWSEARFVGNRPWRIFDLHPDGERFAIGPYQASARRPEAGQGRLHLQLLRRAATDRAGAVRKMAVACSVAWGTIDVNRPHEARPVVGCPLAARHPDNREIPLIYDLHSCAGAPPSQDDAVEVGRACRILPSPDERRERTVPVHDLVHGRSPTTCPFRLACRQRTSPTYEPTGPSPAKPSRRPNGGCGAGGGGAVTPHFVKVTSTGRL